MITSINEWRKHNEASLSSDMANKVKQQMLDEENKEKLDKLIKTAKEMVEAYAKAEAFEIVKKTKNEEIKKLLNDLGTHSIIAEGVLIEVIGTYDNHSTNLTDYTLFVESSVDTLGKQYKEMHDKIMALSTTMKDDSAYLRFNKNPKNLATGTMIDPISTTEGIGSTIMSWITSFKNWVSSFLPKAKKELDNIKEQIKIQQGLTESIIKNVLLNEAKFRSKYKQIIYDNLLENSYNYRDLCTACNDVKPGTSEDYGMYRNLMIMLDDNIVSRVKVGKVFVYSLTTVPSASSTSTGNQASVVPDALLVDTTIDAPVDAVLLKETLEKAKELIAEAEQEKYFLELAKVKEAQVIKMLKEFGMKKVAIDDKIISMTITPGKPTLNKADFMDKMTNAEIVTESIADMAQDLFALYTKTFEVAGSVRQHKDETGLPEGTLGATFDWIIKQVVGPELPITPIVKENVVTDILKKVGSKIKRFISRFNIASKRADMALSHI